MLDMPKYCRIGIAAFFVFMSAWTSSFAGNNSGAAFSAWPDTGQTKCYDNTQEIPCPAPGEPFYGQDAQHSGPARSYTLLGGGTMVQDNVTGLVWEMKTSLDSTVTYSDPHDADNTYTWCDPNPDTNGGDQGTCGDHDTKDLIDQLNSGGGFGGHTDWRLPTIKELATLVDFGRTNTTIDPIFAATTQPSLYWSSTTSAGYPDMAWHVHFYYGYYYYGDKSSAYYMRAVRGGQNPPENRFVDNGDTVTDTATCLQWQKATMDTKNGVGPDTYNWQEALAVTENLSLAGHSDWRLPDINELRSLVDYNRYSPASPAAIDPVFAATSVPSGYWSSTTSTGNKAWYVNFSDGIPTRVYKSSAYYNVRAIRDEQCHLGDVNKDGSVDLSDAMLALQVVTGVIPTDNVTNDNDVNGDVKVGLAEAIYVLQVSAPIIDRQPPVTVSGPSVSGTTATGTTLSATINENGSGYYLVQAAAANEPTSATVVAANHSIAMTANVQATANVSGLTASTDYKIYFVAKDTAGNTQPTVQNIAFTTSTTSDVTPPITVSGPSVSGTTATGTTLSATINENGSGYYLVQAAAANAPTSATVVAANHSIAMTANVQVTANVSGLTASTDYKIYFVAKDTAGNTQPTVQNVAFTSNAPLTVPTVTSLTGRVWMDRNLGEEQVPTSMYGFLIPRDYYQWGRGADGHEKVGRDDPNPTDLNYIAAANAWQGGPNDHNPCPTGFRVPTRLEWIEEFETWSLYYQYASQKAFDSPLRLTLTGHYNVYGMPAENEETGVYWTSTLGPEEGSSWCVFWNTSILVPKVTQDDHIWRKAVRCIKD